VRHPLAKFGVKIAFAAFALILAIPVVGCTRTPSDPVAANAATVDSSRPAIDPAGYYAVLLSNGSVYFGRLEGLGTPYPILRDVFYIQSSVNQETKATSNVLVKRGKELHSPDMMMINDTSILLIEPVGSQSKVAQLIAEANKQP
jgi:hypothetical protein